MTEAEFNIPLAMSEDGYVYRQVHVTFLDKKGRFPKARHFSWEADGLSTYWNEFIDEKRVYHIIGVSYKYKTTDFKNCSDFKIFTFPISFLRNLDGINDVNHSPMFNGNPAPIGFPNIYSHSSVLCQDDEEVRIKLSDFCNDNYDTAHCEVDFELIELEVEKLKEKLNTTEYHVLPE